MDDDSDGARHDRALHMLESHDGARVRVAAWRHGTEWTQALLEVVAGQACEHERTWAYRDAVLLEFGATGDAVAAWLRSGTLSRAGHDIRVSLGDPPAAQPWRRQSMAAAPYGALAWATTDYEFHSSGTARPGGEPLIGPTAPSFGSFQHAAAAFFGVDPFGNPTWTPPSGPHIRFPDRRARIDRATIGPAELVVDVFGDALAGLRVDLASARPGPSVRLAGGPSESVRIPLPDGLPQGASVLVRTDDDWIDRRFLSWPFAVAPEPGVTVEDRGGEADVDRLVAGGEGTAVEFKRQLPDAPDARKKVARTVAAFANGDGGTLLFGIDDDGARRGINRDAQRDADGVANWVRTLVAPIPRFDVHLHDEDEAGGPVLVLTVSPGTEPPYGVDPSSPRFYIRRGATTFPASADQVRALARSRPPADTSATGRFRF